MKDTDPMRRRPGGWLTCLYTVTRSFLRGRELLVDLRHINTLVSWLFSDHLAAVHSFAYCYYTALAALIAHNTLIAFPSIINLVRDIITK